MLELEAQAIGGDAEAAFDLALASEVKADDYVISGQRPLYHEYMRRADFWLEYAANLGHAAAAQNLKAIRGQNEAGSPGGN